MLKSQEKNDIKEWIVLPSEAEIESEHDRNPEICMRLKGDR